MSDLQKRFMQIGMISMAIATFFVTLFDERIYESMSVELPVSRFFVDVAFIALITAVLTTVIVLIDTKRRKK